MSLAANRDEFTLMLARAFDEAWAQYEAWAQHDGPGHGSALPEKVARSSLARHLVALAREGTTEEDALAADGMRYLVALTPAQEHEPLATNGPVLMQPA